MVAGGNGQSSFAYSDPGVALRAGRVSSLCDRMKSSRRASSSGLSIAQAPSLSTIDRAEDTPRQDPAADLRTSRHAANRVSNPNRVAPNLQLATASLRDEGDENDVAAADRIDASLDDISEESQMSQQEPEEQEGLSSLARAKSRIKAQGDEALQKLMEKGRKEMEEITRKVSTDVAADVATGADQGDMLLVANTAGTGLKAARVSLSIFGDSLPPLLKEAMSKQGIPVMHMSKATDVFAYVGFVMQVTDWAAIATIIVPFVVIFLAMTTYTTNCIHGGIDVCGVLPASILSIARSIGI